MNIESTAKQIMSAIQSDAFNEEACEQILRDNCYDVSCATCGEGAVQCACSTFVPRIYRKLEKGEKTRKGDWHVTKDHILRPIKTNQIDAAQPKPESWQEIVDECLENVIEALGQCQKGTARQFIRSAIERSHAAQPQRQRREQAERELSDLAWRYGDQHERLLSTLAAIEKHNEDQLRNMLPDFVDVDLSALREHDAEVKDAARLEQARDDRKHYEAMRKLLVEALEQARAHSKSFFTVREICDDALAKVKEGK